ncbi:hypothetical protein GCM10011583_61610 [Streptomyces camponoticapitis]|uniref:Uncharacterized protein n=1 Tax=Streptomyces camponoticapitis TaxID=1616125 RepID=A0ABQ2EQC2_9ACTN|nr:hypothetical protein [Streptomyces camponoticapitis]GGK21311.1 hypothetical protein GCM10011583_61610 [Streptomyces camponoticapitis]
MSWTTPSQAEGAREEEDLTEPYRTTPSQAEGERDEDDEQDSSPGGTPYPQRA